ncbi:MAG: uberolysin/carnocyclin family circular bacteriocin [Planctomycetota bacterium]
MDRLERPIRLRPTKCALTLVELIVVLFILIGLGGLIIPRIVTSISDARETTSRSSLATVRDAAMQYWRDCKYLIAEQEASNASFAVRIDDLMFNPFGSSGAFDPSTGLGWRGPYLAVTNQVTIDDPNRPLEDLPDAFRLDSNFDRYFRVNTTTATEVPAILDTWGTPIIIQDVTAFNTSGGTAPILGQERILRVVSAGSGPSSQANAQVRRNLIKVDHDPEVEEVEDSDTPDDLSLTFVVR